VGIFGDLAVGLGYRKGPWGCLQNDERGGVLHFSAKKCTLT